MRRLGLLGVALLTLLACGGGAPAAPRPAPGPSTRVLDAGALEGHDGGDLPSLASLVGLGPSLAPGMRETDRVELTGDDELVHEIARFEKDGCVRVTFATSTSASATLVDANGVVLARTGDAVTAGWLGERGPACVRPQASPLKIRLRAESAGPLRARLVVWMLP